MASSSGTGAFEHELPLDCIADAPKVVDTDDSPKVGAPKCTPVLRTSTLSVLWVTARRYHAP